MKSLATAALLAIALASPVRADETRHLAEGVVRKVDREAQKITLRHGPLPSLDMPMPMTMVYRVRDPALLDRLKAGDKVKFEAENENGTFFVTKIAPAK